MPGIRIIETPGHTPGYQSVLINTAEGIVSITGEALNLTENLNEALPPGILYDTTAALKSIQRIRAYTDQIIARHDPNIEDSQDHSFRKRNKQVYGTDCLNCLRKLANE